MRTKKVLAKNGGRVRKMQTAAGGPIDLTPMFKFVTNKGTFGGGSYGGGGAGGRFNTTSNNYGNVNLISILLNAFLNMMKRIRENGENGGSVENNQQQPIRTLGGISGNSSNNIRQNSRIKTQQNFRPIPDLTLPEIVVTAKRPNKPIHVVSTDVPETAQILLSYTPHYNRKLTREDMRQRGINPYQQGSLLRKQLRKYLNGEIQQVSPTVQHIADREVVENPVWTKYHLSSSPSFIKDIGEFFN